MTVDELAAEDETRTRPCRVCGVELNAASARCPYCGTRQFRRQPVLGMWGLLICLVAVGAAILITRALTLPSHAPTSYAAYRGRSLAALVPDGWDDLFLSAPHGTALAGWRDSGDGSDTETVQATRPASGTPTSREAATVRRLRNTPGVALGYHGPVVFPGGQAAAAVVYTQGPLYAGVYTFDACNHAVAVTVTITASRRTVLDDLSLVLPQAANPICDGPAFATRSTANPQVPLRVPR